MTRPKLALARVNYSQLYKIYDGGKTYRERDVLIPYHLANLAGHARAAGADVRIFDGEVDLLNEEELAARIAEWRPAYVGLTATTPDIDLTLDLAGALKRLDPSIVTVVGGVHASVEADEVAAHAQVDYVVVGDGEDPLTQLVTSGARPSDAADPARKIVRTDRRTDMRSLPMPAHDLLDYAKYQFTDPTRGRMRAASVMSARGCPFRCTFCCHDREMRYRPVSEFLEEIRFLHEECGVRYFFVYDDTLLVNRQRVFDIADGIRALGLRDANFQCQGRANLMERSMVDALAGAHFVRMSMGVESGSAEMLKRCSKDVTLEQCAAAFEMLDGSGLQPRASFIIGHPYETRDTARETIDFAKQLCVVEANFTVMTPYPGTQMYAQAVKGEGIHFAQPEFARQWSVFRRWGKPIIRTDALSPDELEELRETAIMEFYTQDKVFAFYKRMFDQGNRSRYFFRPLNFAWKRRYGRDIPFWEELGETEVLSPEERRNA